MTLTLVGMGCGSAATLTEEGRQALLQADLLIGASRLLEDCLLYTSPSPRDTR